VGWKPISITREGSFNEPQERGTSSLLDLEHSGLVNPWLIVQSIAEFSDSAQVPELFGGKCPEVLEGVGSVEGGNQAGVLLKSRCD
jgi:hypothetical protein